MARFSLQTLEMVSQLQHRTSEALQPGGNLARLVPGQIIRAEVLQSLGNELFMLNIRGNEIVGSSSQPLTPGQALNVQVGTTVNGQISLHLLTANSGAVANVAVQQDVAALENNLPVDARGRILVLNESTAQARPAAMGEPAVLGQLRNLVGQTASEAGTSREALQSQQILSNLIRPDGPLARLLAQRPDLTARIEQLLTPLQNRPEGLGPQLQQLTGQLARLIRTATPQQQAALATSQNRLLGQLVGMELLDKPQQLAQFLSNRLTSLARGLEATIARPAAAPATVTPGTISPGSAAPGSLPPGTVAPGTVTPGPVLPGTATPGTVTPGTVTPGMVTPGTVLANTIAGQASEAPIPVPTSVTAAAGREGVPTQAEVPTSPTNLAAADIAARAAAVQTARAEGNLANTVIQSAFEGDLKGQLLALRSQLQSLAGTQAEPSPTIQQAITQVNVLLDQVASQQVRNLDGLNQFLYVEVPVDPRSGIDEARLHVFYRKNKRKSSTFDWEQFTVALFLHLTSLGDIMAVITGSGNGVTVGFTVQDPNVEKMITEHSEELREGLIKTGHSAATVTVTSPKAKPDAESASSVVSEELWPLFLDIQPRDDEPGTHLDSEA